MNKINTLATHIISDENNFSFSANDYSKFKYGSSEIGNKFGTNLFFRLIALRNKELCSYKKIYVFSSPYNYIPTATNTILKSFSEHLIKHLEGISLVEIRKIHRNTTYTDDYGSLSKEERFSLISNDTFNIKNDFNGDELLIFLDDIKITGSHEFVVKKTLINNKIENDVYFLYHAILDNKNINPTFENFLNYSYVKGVNEIIEIYNNADFVINTRFTKFILSLSRENFFLFINQLTPLGLDEIITNSKGNGYDKVLRYSENLKKIIKLQKNKKLYKNK